MGRYLERRRTYVNLETKETSFDIVDVLPRHLKLNLRYVRYKEKTNEGQYNWRWGQRMSNDTLFRGIELLPPGPAIQESQLPPRGSVKPTDILEKVREVICQDWRKEQTKVVMHSGGYDSRLLSMLLKQMRYTDVLFLCTKIEGDAFRQIMEFEGWSPRNYMVYQERTPYPEYFAESILDFRGAWKRLGGVARVPANLFWYPVASLQKSGRLPPDEKIDMWYTQYSDTVFSQLGAGDARHFNGLWNRFYYHNIRSRPFKCHAEFSPWLNLDVIEAIGGLDKASVSSKGPDSPAFKIGLCELAEKGLSQMPNPHGWGDERIRISERLSRAARDAYRTSWYGQEIASEVAGVLPRSTQFSDYWEHWTSASLCEHLRQEGYEIS